MELNTLPLNFLDQRRKTITTEPVKVIRQNTIAMFNFEVEDDQWTSAHSSPKLDKTINVGDVEWDIKILKKNVENVPCIGLNLICGSKITSTLWRIKATVKIVIRKKDTNTTVERIFRDHTFTYVTKSIDESIPWAEVDDILMCNSSESPKSIIPLLIEVHITIDGSYGFRRRARYIYNFFEVAQESDIALIIENKELFINSSYLSMLSPYFRSLHCSKVKEPRYGDLQVISINDVTLEDFLELLHVVYPSKKSITVENVEVMLALGDRFLFESVLIECENFLVTPAAETIDVFIKLEWASKYAMADLQAHCLTKLSSPAAVRAVKNSLVYETLSLETHKVLLEIMLKFSSI